VKPPVGQGSGEVPVFTANVKKVLAKMYMLEVCERFLFLSSRLFMDVYSC